MNRTTVSAAGQHEAQRLPSAVPFVTNMTRSVLETLAGVRQVGSLAGWFDEEAYLLLVNRSALAQRARLVRGAQPQRPAQQIQTLLTSSPRRGVVEATVILVGTNRTRAAAIRTEWHRGNWRVTSFTIL